MMRPIKPLDNLGMCDHERTLSFVVPLCNIIYSDLGATDCSMSSPGSRLKEARIRAGFDTAADFAKRVGWKDVTYRSYESDQNHYTKHADLFASRLGVPVEWLLYGNGSPTDGSFSAARDVLDDTEAVVTAILLKLGQKPGAAEALGRVARQAVSALQGHPPDAATRVARAQTAIDILMSESHR